MMAGLLFGQSRTAPRQIPINDLRPETAGQAIAEFRATRFASDFCFSFELTHFPRRGEALVYEGYLWGMPTIEGANFRLLLWQRGHEDSPIQYLMRSGPIPQVWTGGLGQAVRALSPSAQSAPLAPGLLYSPFDIMMPFLYWADWTYEGPKRVQSRSTDLFFFRAPAEHKAAHPNHAGIRVALDRAFNALIYAQMVDDDGKNMRTFRIVDLKKSGEQWVVKRIDFLDEQTRDKDRFSVTAAALPLNIPNAFFTPKALETRPSLPPAQAFDVF